MGKAGTRFPSGLLAVCLAWSVGCGSDPAAQEVALTAADSVFAELLADLHFADAAALLDMENDVFVPDSALRDSVLAANGLDYPTFSAQASAYSADPERFLAVYNRAVDVAAGR
ncbi:MAG: hypothetical protein O3C45_03685 [Bacteroidetes bacterium]|nr:hypothetical protein [Bacteroidota bacterium]